MRLYPYALLGVSLSICLSSTIASSAQSAELPLKVTTLMVRVDPPGPRPNFISLSTPRVVIKAHIDKEAATLAAGKMVFRTEIEVVPEPRAADTDEGFQRVFTPREVEMSAGTFGDPSRYVQTMAGVVSDNDQRNDFLVRGGNPSENGFVIDNIEIPSINQLALSDTTGGFVSMLDASAIQQFTLHTDAYDEKFDERLSSIVDISTRPSHTTERHSESEMGIAGFGGSVTRPFSASGSYFVSARQSVLQYVTKDIGMNGVPVYRNAFARAENRIGDRDSWWGISLTGIDAILMTPSSNDDAETNPYNVSYSGWRNTTGLNWQHVYSGKSFGVASFAQASQSQSIQESDQLQADASIYTEHSMDAISTLKYDWTFQPNSAVTITAGARESVDKLNYSVVQPIGLQNPYSADPTPLNATAMSAQFATDSTAGYAQAVFALPHSSKLVIGGREMQWALGGHTGTTGKVLFSSPLIGKLAHVGYSEYEQLPPTLYMLSFNNLKTLAPIRSRQLTGGIVLADSTHEHVAIELYEKKYYDYPVAADFPQLSMANIADTFGQAFLMFPMVSRGSGVARGAELTAQSHLSSSFDATLTMAYARDWYSGLDGNLRKGNFDIPLSVNLTSTWQVGRGLALSARYTTTSGRPYTPDNLTLSTEQNRDVYDLNEINGVRSSAYHRLDFRFEQTRKIGRGAMTWHAGLQNALNNKNFYALVWEPRTIPGGQAEQNQMPIFPDGGVKYAF